MEKQRDKQARRMQRKLARQSGATEGEGGPPIEEFEVPEDAAEPEAENQNPEG